MKRQSWRFLTAAVIGAALFVSCEIPIKPENSFFSPVTPTEPTAPPDLRPPAPDMPLVSASETSMTVQWNSVADAESYEVYYNVSGSPPPSSPPPEPLEGTPCEKNTSCVVIISGLTSKTRYYVWVKAVNQHGTSGYSPAGYGTPWPTTYELPETPQNVKVSTGVQQLAVSWDTAGGATGYEVYYCQSDTPPSSLTEPPTTNQKKETPETKTVINGLTNNLVYYIWVRAKNSHGASAYSEMKGGIPEAATAPPKTPGKPELVAESGNITVSWPPVEMAASYELRLGISDAQVLKQETVGADVLQKEFTGLQNETTYYVWIKAKNNVGESGFSPAASATPSIYNVVPPDPSTAPTVTHGDKSLTVSWTAVPGAQSYEVWTTITNDSGSAKKNGPDVSGTITTLTGLANGTVYYVWIKAKNRTGTSGFSPGADGTPSLPVVPGNLRVNAANSTSVSIAWDPVGGVVSYNVYRSASEAGTYKKVNTTTVGETGYTDTELAAFTTYYYKVCTVTSGIEGGWSEVLPVTTLLPAPNNLRVSTQNSNSVSLEWDSTSGASGYNLYRSTNENGDYSQVNTGSITTASDTGLASVTVYYYKVRAVTAGSIEGEWSSAVSASTGIIVPGSGIITKLAWLQIHAASDTVYGIILDADENIAPQTLSYSDKTNITIIMKGTEQCRTITLSANGALFTVESGVTLTLDSNITLKGRNSNNNSVVRVNSGGSLLMNGGEISGNTVSSSYSYSYGGGVYVSYGTFTMNGGEISGNTASSPYSSYGGGVYVSNGTFTMNGGEISGNTASSPYSSYGGGVYVSSGTFTMNGGEISSNTASSSSYSYGGGVYVSSGTFTMNGGEISSNTASSSYSYSYGGGVYVSYGTFTMNGGEISGNTASSPGGGVYVSESSTIFRMGGGVVYGSNAATGLKNTAYNGAALYFSGGTGEYGLFTGDDFYKAGNLSTTNDTVRVVNGNLQSN